MFSVNKNNFLSTVHDDDGGKRGFLSCDDRSKRSFHSSLARGFWFKYMNRRTEQRAPRFPIASSFVFIMLSSLRFFFFSVLLFSPCLLIAFRTLCNCYLVEYNTNLQRNASIYTMARESRVMTGVKTSEKLQTMIHTIKHSI